MHTVVYAVVVCFVAHSLYQAAVGGAMARAWVCARSIRLRHVATNLVVQTLTIAVAGLLHQLPGGSIGWWSAIGGEGSILLGSTAESAVPFERWISIALVGSFIIVAPVLAHAEEDVFRRGSEWRRPWQRGIHALWFGLAHLLMGIPIAVAVALTIPGLWFTSRYLVGYRDARSRGNLVPVAQRAGIAAASAYHVAWNWTLAAAAFATLALG